jgi:hypothetical protein
VDADLFEDTHRTIVNARDCFVVERFDRRIAVARQRPRNLLDGGGTGAAQIAGATAGAPPARLSGRLGGVEHQTTFVVSRVTCPTEPLADTAAINAHGLKWSGSTRYKIRISLRNRPDRDIR